MPVFQLSPLPRPSRRIEAAENRQEAVPHHARHQILSIRLSLPAADVEVVGPVAPVLPLADLAGSSCSILRSAGRSAEMTTGVQK